MIKVQVIEKFTLKDFDELKNIKRKTTGEKGKLYVGDTFECSEEMARYLLGDNPLHKPVVNIVEIQPEKKPEEPKVVIKEVAIEVPKKQKKKNSKK